MAPERLREHARRLDGWRVAEVGEDEERPEREAPRPAVAALDVLGRAGHLDHAEDGLPHGRVEDRDVPRLDGGSPGRPVRRDRGGVDLRSERTVAAAADEKPPGHGRAAR
jgi:hypothetical protein